MNEDRAMHPGKWTALPNGQKIAAAAGCLALAVSTFVHRSAQTNAPSPLQVQGSPHFSGDSLKVALSVAKYFHFIGTQTVNLYGNAEAEQFVFAKRSQDGTLE